MKTTSTHQGNSFKCTYEKSGKLQMIHVWRYYSQIHRGVSRGGARGGTGPPWNMIGPPWCPPQHHWARFTVNMTMPNAIGSERCQSLLDLRFAKQDLVRVFQTGVRRETPRHVTVYGMHTQLQYIILLISLTKNVRHYFRQWHFFTDKHETITISKTVLNDDNYDENVLTFSSTNKK